ncbi:uncharacterized protein LOC105218217 [Zeugodacus cucurbitae]|uniref:uncharacterized protein LOC105218217 n=1 Tax=Zeugodacus cucurbitae TaxID=28588 RepID=UPI000596933E|nr:uncharacterized protein LOC105218217 [Zeugodacus cucurbitae]
MEMHIYFYFQLIISFQVCLSHVRPDAANVVPFAPATPPKASKCAQHKSASTVPKNALQFRLPFMDMNIQNERNLHIMQESSKQQLFILHGNELYVLIVSGEEKRVSLVGMLAGGVRQHEPIGAEVIAWRNYLLLVIALEEYLEIYQLNAVVLAQNAEAAKLGQVVSDTTTNFEPIQQLTINGRFRKLFLFNVAEGQIMLLTAVNYTKLQSKLRTFVWSNTFFELVEDLTIPAVHVLEIVGTTPKFLLSGRLIKHQGRTIVVVYEVDANDLHLRNRQTLTVPSSTIHAYTFRGRNYLIGCAAQQQKCNTFWMKRDELQFSLYRQFNGKELAFERFRAGQHFLVGTYQRAVNIYPTARMDCYASYTAKESEVSEIIAHVSQLNESYVLLSYRRPFNTLLRIFEVEAADGQRLGAPAALNETMLEDLNALQQHRHLFEGTIQRLRSLLLQRKTAMDTFRKAALILRPKIKTLKAPHPVRLHAGNIGIVKIVGASLQSPVQLLRRVAELRAPQRSARFMRATYQKPAFVLDMPRVARIRRLHVGNLVYNGSLLPGFHLDNTSSARQPILSIRSAIRTKVLSTSQLLTRQSFRNARENTERSHNAPLRVGDLIAERINNVSVTEFLNSLFLRNRDRKLKGGLKLYAETKVDSLWTPLLNDLVVAQIFNLKEPQIVSTKIKIESMDVKDMQVDLVNGLNLIEDVAFSGRDDLIEGPVEIKQMNIAGDLLVDYQPKVERTNDDMDSQFRQFYTGKVIINGTLVIDNLELDNDMATGVFVSGKSFARSILGDTYLLQNTPQDIGTAVHFENAKVTTPKLTTNWLNDHPTTQHLLTTGHQMHETPLLLIFMQAKVDGDVICKAYKSKLLELSEDVVRQGDTTNITGLKIFEAPLIVEHLTAAKLNDLHASDLVLKSQLKNAYHFHGNKSFDKLVVTKDAYVDQALNYTYLNELNVNAPLKRDHFFKYLHLPYHLQTTNIVLHKINGISFDKIFDRLSVEHEKLVLHKDLLVKGNVAFLENLQVDTINDITWTDYVSDLVRINENAVINGSTIFMQGLTVQKTLKTPTINNIDMLEVFSNVLLKSKPQQITGNYTFGNLRLTNLDVDTINDVSTKTFIDTRNEALTLSGDLILPKLTVQGDVNGKFENSFRYATLNEQLQQLSHRRWRNLVVHGNAYWNESSTSSTKQYEELQYLYRHAVRRSADQIISGTVYMTQPLISRMRTRNTFPKGVDLNYIARDCLLKYTTSPQTITSGKLFHKPLRLQRAVVNGPLRISTLNTIDVPRFHASLYRISSDMPIEGPLHFKIPPIVGQLLVQGLVNGMPTAQIYTTSHGLMPPVKMYSLVVDEDLEIGDVNDMSLDYLLSNRIKLHGEPQDVQGFLVFENLILNNETLLQSINGIPIDDMVFRKSGHVQVIDGPKEIAGDLILNGPTHVLNLNGARLIDMYKQSILTMANYHFDNLTIDEGTFVKGLVLVGNMPLKTKGRTMQADDTSEKLEDMSQVEAELEDLIELEDTAAYREELTDVVNELAKLLSAQNASLTTNHNNQSSQQHLLYLDFDFSTEVLRQYANESVDETLLFDLQHITMCEHRMLQLQYSAESRRLFITNVTMSSLTARTDTIWVKAQNYCGDRYKKVKSKVTVNGRKVANIFGMKKFIESLELFVSAKQNTFLLLHAIDETRNRNEVRMLRINDERNDIADWQTIPFGVGKSMRLFKFENLTVLISNALVNNQHAVSIYHFHSATEHFKLAQVIDGPFDVLEMVAVQPQRYQLLLSCHKCHNINVYELTGTTVSSYKLMQIIKLPMRIDKLHAFTMGDGELYLLSLGEQQQDFYHLHRYAYIQGWVHSTFGYFRNIQLAVPLSGALSSANANDLLLLLCGGVETDRCSVVRAFKQ